MLTCNRIVVKHVKKNNRDVKTELSRVLPVNVCNIVGEDNITCFKCQSLYLKEMELMKDQELPDEGLERARTFLGECFGSETL